MRIVSGRLDDVSICFDFSGQPQPVENQLANSRRDWAKTARATMHVAVRATHTGQKVVLISVEVGQGIGNISMEWKFNVFKLVYSWYVGAGAWSMRELSKGRPIQRLKACKSATEGAKANDLMEDACRKFPRVRTTHKIVTVTGWCQEFKSDYLLIRNLSSGCWLKILASRLFTVTLKAKGHHREGFVKKCPIGDACGGESSSQKCGGANL